MLRESNNNFKAIDELVRKYSIPGNVTDPEQYLRERGIANPIDLMALEQRLKWIQDTPRNIQSKHAMLCQMELRAGAKDASGASINDVFAALIERSYQLEAEQDGEDGPDG